MYLLIVIDHSIYNTSYHYQYNELVLYDYNSINCIIIYLISLYNLYCDHYDNYFIPYNLILLQNDFH